MAGFGYLLTADPVSASRYPGDLTRSVGARLAPRARKSAAWCNPRRVQVGTNIHTAGPLKFLQQHVQAELPPTYIVACACLDFYSKAFCTEVVRGGVSAVPATTRRASGRPSRLGR
jgi:hypothetical protein